MKKTYIIWAFILLIGSCTVYTLIPRPPVMLEVKLPSDRIIRMEGSSLQQKGEEIFLLYDSAEQNYYEINESLTTGDLPEDVIVATIVKSTPIRPVLQKTPDRMNGLFYWCVEVLEFSARRIGTTYEVINVWIFCILWPLFTLVLLVIIIVQRIRINSLKQLVKRLISDSSVKL